MNLKVALAQIRIVTGDLDGNLERIIAAYNRAAGEGADIVVFPETAFSGYCCGSLFDQVPFIEQQLERFNQFRARVRDTVAVIGFVDLKGPKRTGFPVITNACAVIQNGVVCGVHDKILLANSHHHEDRHYFEPGKFAKPASVQIRGTTVKIGTPICEDIWSGDHQSDIVQWFADAGADIICVPNFSYFTVDKVAERLGIVAKHVLNKKIPIVYVNAIGIGDIVKNFMIYDGGSFAINTKGEVTAAAKQFSEDIRFFNTEPSRPFDLGGNYHLGEYGKLYEGLSYAIREVLTLSGIKKAQVHVSGGVDSAVVAALAVNAMGAENCIFITNPSNDNTPTTLNYARHIASKLKVQLFEDGVGAMPSTLITQASAAFGDTTSAVYDEQVVASMKTVAQAVGRTVKGLMASHLFKTGIIACGNLTENVLGWANFHDIGSIGVMQVIGDLSKREVFKLAGFINRLLGDEVIPHQLYETGADDFLKPAAELADAGEDPIDYELMSGICDLMIRERMTPLEIIDYFKTGGYREIGHLSHYFDLTYVETIPADVLEDRVWEAFNLSKRSVYKSAQAAPIVLVHTRTRGFSDRETLINHYNGGRPRPLVTPISPELLELAGKAIESINRRKNDDINEWASRLARDNAKWTD